jgi:hypothetical protein
MVNDHLVSCHRHEACAKLGVRLIDFVGAWDRRTPVVVYCYAGISRSPRSPWQNPCVEHLISSIRRECLDHVIIFNERHLRRVLSSYFQYHHDTERISRFAKTARDLVLYNLPRPAISLPNRRLGVCTTAMSVEPLEEGRIFLLAPIQLPSGQF